MNESNDIWESRPQGLGDAALIAWALTEIAAAIRQHYHAIGTGDAATPMGAIEFLGKSILDGCVLIAQAAEARRGEEPGE